MACCRWTSMKHPSGKRTGATGRCRRPCSSVCTFARRTGGPCGRLTGGTEPATRAGCTHSLHGLEVDDRLVGHRVRGLLVEDAVLAVLDDGVDLLRQLLEHVFLEAVLDDLAL